MLGFVISITDFLRKNVNDCVNAQNNVIALSFLENGSVLSIELIGKN